MVAGGLWENGEMATGDEFDALLVEAGRTPMRGWEYDYGGRIRLEPPPWDFPGRMLERCRAAASLLDMGTGGGPAALQHAPREIPWRRVQADACAIVVLPAAHR
ncbi:hypothetical protein Q4R95_19400, partial [Morganella morganii]